MALFDWSQCPAVESIPGKVSGAWVFRGTRTPVAIIFENLEDGMTIDEVMEQFPVTREHVKAVLERGLRAAANGREVSDLHGRRRWAPPGVVTGWRRAYVHIGCR